MITLAIYNYCNKLLCIVSKLWLMVTDKINTSAGYFISERKFSWWLMIGQSFGSGKHAHNFIIINV